MFSENRVHNLNPQVRGIRKYEPSSAVDISFVVPCYNEEKNVKGALDTIKAAMESSAGITYEVILIDDVSTDRTLEEVSCFLSTNPAFPLSIYQNTTNQGIAVNYVFGASVGHGRWYMVINGDDDTPVDAIHTLLSALGQADMVIPFVVNQRERPLSRWMLSFLYAKFFNVLSGNRIRYYNGPVIHCREKVIKNCPAVLGPGYQVQLICAGLKQGLSYREVSIRCIANPRTSIISRKHVISICKTAFVILRRRFSIGRN